MTFNGNSPKSISLSAKTKRMSSSNGNLVTKTFSRNDIENLTFPTLHQIHVAFVFETQTTQTTSFKNVKNREKIYL